MRNFVKSSGATPNNFSFVLQYFFIFFVGRIIFSANASYGVGYYFSLCILVVFILSPIFLPKKWFFLHCLMMIFSHPDITQDNLDVEVNGVLPSASIWQFSLVGEPTIVWVLLIFSIYFFRLRRLAIDVHLLSLAFLFLLLPLVTGTINGFIMEIGRVIVDLKFGVMLILGLIFFNNPFLSKNNTLPFILPLILAGSFCVIFYDLGVLIMNILQRQEYKFENLSMDVAKILVLFVFYWSMLSVKVDLRLPAYLGLMALSLILIFEYQTRWLILTLLAGMLFLPGKYIFRGAAVIIVGSAFIVFLFLSESQAIVLMVNRFNIFDGIDLATIDPNRYFSLLNAIEALSDKSGWLFGMGAGSYFTDTPYLLNHLSTASYDQVSLDQGKYYRLHDFFTHFIFKIGLVGFVGYAYLVVSYLRLWGKKVVYPEGAKVLMYCLLCMLPTLLTFPFYTSKGVLLTAFFFSVFRKMRLAPFAREFV